MLHLLELMVIAGTLIVTTFLVLCALYVVSPVDALLEIALGPFGVVDDLAAVVAVVSTAMVTMRAQRQKHPDYSDPYFN